MERYAQFSITIGALGIVITLIGLFPGLTGLEATEGVGVLQVVVILVGFSLLFVGAYVFAKWTFYPRMPNTLAQSIGIRLTLTGLVMAAAAGWADVLGFGSHPVNDESRPLLGDLQALAFVGSILIASSGVVIFALFGPPREDTSSAPGDDDDSTLSETD